MGKVLKENEKICWPPKLGSAVIMDGQLRTPGGPTEILSLLVQVVLDPMPTEKCVLAKCFAPESHGSPTPMTISFGIKDMAIQESYFKFLRNQKGKTIAQIGETPVDF